MNWLTNFIRPGLRSLVGDQKEVPDNLWQKCPSCEGMLFHTELKAANNVCYHCNHHLKIGVMERLNILFDDGKFEKFPLPNVPLDPLKFKDKKKYSDRMRDSQNKTREKDALVIAKGKIGAQDAIVAAFNFDFMGGSMGTAVGEGIVRAAEKAVKHKAALIVIPASGGARMQEGALSLMQMPRTTVAVNMVKAENLPYIVLLTNPTTGGVSASFAMLGDIHLAEPGTTIGFAGRRVIEKTVREILPDDFQTAEYLLEHGMVDAVVSRQDQNAEIGKILTLLMEPVQEYSAKEKGSKNGKNGASAKGKKQKSGKKASNVTKLSTKKTKAKKPKKQQKPAEQEDEQMPKRKTASG